ncbi:TetR/AcrR family transcriptional regulator [Actinoplanes sp. HUAS TT8]|uniref:TetR/AcrR family transcriptional regulator n=1 Tax=Actinoplanes sp. HUAS TT8 TaxID=3447453 RepID=UPI003F522F64
MQEEADAALRVALIEAAERQLAASADGDIATRAVCDEVGVTQPVLYRLFRDKRGLLAAVAEAGSQRYARHKLDLEQTGDPVADLYAGWDDHMAFAAANPALYRLMFTTSAAHQRILDLLEAALVRVAAAGALRMTPRQAARLILPANIGVALARIAHPALYDDADQSHRMRDAVFAAVLTEPAAPAGAVSDPVRGAARQLRSQLTLAGTDRLEPVEVALLDRWLERMDVTPEA